MKSKKDKIIKVIIYFILFLGMLAILLPMYLVIVTALKPASEIAQNFFALPESIYLGNFKTVLAKAEFLKVFFNSFYITFISSILVITFIPMVGYSIARNFHKKFYRCLFYLFITAIFVPFQVIMLPQIKILQGLGLMSGQGLIILYTTFALVGNVFLIVGYIRTVPIDMEESAYIDGASVLRTFFTIVYPVIKPITITIFILHTLFVWNDYLLPLLVLNKDKDLYTLPLFQVSFRSQYSFDYNTVFAAYFVSIIPITIVYAIFQKHIIGGLTQGSVRS